MQSIALKSHGGADGVLKLNVPLEVSDTDVEVLVVVHPLATSSSKPHPGWPLGFLEQTFGSWQGEPLERPEQGKYEIREEMI